MLTARIANNPFSVYTKSDVALELSSRATVKEGDRIDVRFPNSWTIGNDPSFTKQLQTGDPNGRDHISVETSAPDCELALRTYGADYFTVGPTWRHGRNIELRVRKGKVPAKTPLVLHFNNTMSSRIAEIEEIWVALNGKRISSMPEIITLAGEHYMMRVVVPSSAIPGEEFPVHIVSLDPFFNLSSTRHRDIRLLDHDGRVVEEGIDFTGRTTVQTSIEEEGTYRFNVGDVLSNPIMISREFRGPCWGDIHIHSRLSHDGIGRYPYRYARDVSCLDFAAVADHEIAMYDEKWDITQQAAREENAPGSFPTILAYEAGGNYPAGHHNVYFYDDTADAPPTDAPLSVTEVWPKLTKGRAITIPHHTGIGWSSDKREQSSAVSFETDDMGFRTAIEIYSQHGQSELYDPHHCLAYEINRAHNEGRRVNYSIKGPYYARDAWAAGRRWGVIASSDDHYGQGGKPFQGIAAVYAPVLDRNAILDAIRSRRTYGTTGERILIDFRINTASMGETLKTPGGGKLRIQAEAHGTSPILRLEILRYVFAMGEYEVAYEWTDLELDAEIAFEDTFIDDCFYYLRLSQKNLIEHRRPMAWTSPIWVEKA